MITLFLAFLFLLNIPIFAEESKTYTNQDLYKPTNVTPIEEAKPPWSQFMPVKKGDIFDKVESQEQPKQEVKKPTTFKTALDFEDPFAVKGEEKPSFTFLGNEYEIDVKQLNILVGIVVGIVVIVFFIILWEKKRTKVIYYSIFSVLIIAGIGAFSINYFRYETILN